MKKPPKRPELAPATISEADGVRYLHLGTPWVQGAMRIRKPLPPTLPAPPKAPIRSTPSAP